MKKTDNKKLIIFTFFLKKLITDDFCKNVYPNKKKNNLCLPASPMKGFGTERARLDIFKEISKNCRFFTQKEKKPVQNLKFCMKN